MTEHATPQAASEHSEAGVRLAIPEFEQAQSDDRRAWLRWLVTSIGLIVTGVSGPYWARAALVAGVVLDGHEPEYYEPPHRAAFAVFWLLLSALNLLGGCGTYLTVRSRRRSIFEALLLGQLVMGVTSVAGFLLFF